MAKYKVGDIPMAKQTKLGKSIWGRGNTEAKGVFGEGGSKKSGKGLGKLPGFGGKTSGKLNDVPGFGPANGMGKGKGKRKLSSVPGFGPAKKMK